MRTTEEVVNGIKRWEGKVLKAYKCPAGVWTIGYGHTRGVKEGMTITEETATQFLKEDIESVEQTLNKYGLPELNDNQWGAIVSFCFNLGCGKFKTSTLCRKIKANPKDDTIPYEFGRWVRGGGKVLTGLVKRRAWEAALWQR